MGVDGRVDVVVTDPGGRLMGDVAPPVGSPAAARWDATQLLHVDVDELSGSIGVDPPNDLTGRAVHPGEPVEPVADQYLVDGGGGQTHDARDPSRAEFAAPAEPDDPPFQVRGRAVGTAAGTAGTVLETGVPFLQPPVPPLVCGLAGDPHLGRYMGHRPSGGNPFHQDHSTRTVSGALPCI